MNFEEYYKICNDGILLKKVKKFKKIENPKVSIISSIYNKQKIYIKVSKEYTKSKF